MRAPKRRGPSRAFVARALFVPALLFLATCYRHHAVENGMPVTVLTADLDLLQLPSAAPEPARGAYVRAERCDDGAVAEARTDGNGVAWIAFEDGELTGCWTLTAVLLGARPTALTLVRAEAPLASPLVLDQSAPFICRPPCDPGSGSEPVAVDWSVAGLSDPESGVTVHGKRVYVAGSAADVISPIGLERFSTTHDRDDLLEETTLLAIEWLDGIPVNGTTLALGPIAGGVAAASIIFPSPATNIHHVRLPFHLPASGAYPFGPLEDYDEWWGTGGAVWGMHAGGGESRIGELVFEYDAAKDPPWTVEAIWPDLPWAEVLRQDPRLGFVFVREGPDGDGVHGFVDGPIAEGSHLVIPPLEAATLTVGGLEELSVRVGGEGHVGFLWVQGAEDAFIEHSRYRIYSAPDAPLALDAWPTLPGGLALEDLGLDGSIRATAGVSDPHGNPGWMELPLEQDLGRRLYVAFASTSEVP